MLALVPDIEDQCGSTSDPRLYQVTHGRQLPYKNKMTACSCAELVLLIETLWKLKNPSTSHQIDWQITRKPESAFFQPETISDISI